MHDNQNAIRDSCCVGPELSKNVFQSKIQQLWKVTSFFLNKVSWCFGPNPKLSDFAQIDVEGIHFWVAESEYALCFVIFSNTKKLYFFEHFQFYLINQLFLLIELELHYIHKHDILDYNWQSLIFFAILSSSPDEYSA